MLHKLLQAIGVLLGRKEQVADKCAGVKKRACVRSATDYVTSSIRQEVSPFYFASACNLAVAMASVEGIATA